MLRIPGVNAYLEHSFLLKVKEHVFPKKKKVSSFFFGATAATMKQHAVKNFMYINKDASCQCKYAKYSSAQTKTTSKNVLNFNYERFNCNNFTIR